MSYKPLSDEEERISEAIVDAAHSVHKNIGSGLSEYIYEVYFCNELTKQRLSIRRQMPMPLTYGKIKFDEGLRLDILVEDLILCQLRAVENLNVLHTAQLLTQLKLTGKRVGYLFNFNAPSMEDGIKRLII